MRTLIGSFLALAVAGLMYGCGPRDARYDPTHFRVRGVLAPRDVVLPRGTRSAGYVNGLYTLDGNAFGLCCLVGTHARLLVRKYGPAEHLYIGITLPQRMNFKPTRLTVALPSVGLRQTVSLDEVGYHMVEIVVPKELRARRGDIAVTLDCSEAYQPAPKGPKYGFVLMSIYFA